MKKKLRNIKLLVASSLLVGCGNSSLNEVTNSGSTNTTSAAELRYQDVRPDVANAGSATELDYRIVFVSYRDTDTDGENVAKIYKYDSASTDPSRFHSDDTFHHELDVKISSNGAYVAFITQNTEGAYQLFVEKWDNSSRVEITAPTGLVRWDEVVFADDNAGLAYSGLVSNDGTEQYVTGFAKLVETDNTLSVQTSATIADSWQPRLTSSGSTEYLVVRSLNDQFQSSFSTYQIDDTGAPTLSSLKSTTASISIQDEPVEVDGSGIYVLRERDTARLKERIGDVAPGDDNKSARNYIYLRNEIASEPLTTDSNPTTFTGENFLLYEPSDIYGLQSLGDNLFAVLGGDPVICTKGSSFLSTILIYNASTGAVVPLYVKTNADTRVSETLVVQACEHFVENTDQLLQPFEREIRSFRIRKQDENTFFMVYEGWDGGDGEIYYARFTVASLEEDNDAVKTDANISSQEVKAISANVPKDE
ncbi:hypothetical protein [Pseudobacteriovorax antillogorgiicola]|uniref:Uncharacterized protein n=1 Tax=Pseudobacteriovorax antillogorgiicola TaxID=1513793 RepID=A0A1Y6B854_9BACT|nr:hypothetical protein [Pseudobacteriovorax antillogorgiicola]TCS59329.1 hypothetical protein EDD56_101236 [Pseudobacteriovorax antillogorgiicola]SME89315.1 hypothetical protein SAMN06296036_101250 [Pseudobacteriovorax antillogorgiicola]